MALPAGEVAIRVVPVDAGEETSIWKSPSMGFSASMKSSSTCESWVQLDVHAAVRYRRRQGLGSAAHDAQAHVSKPACSRTGSKTGSRWDAAVKIAAAPIFKPQCGRIGVTQSFFPMATFAAATQQVLLLGMAPIYPLGRYSSRRFQFYSPSGLRT